MEDMYSTDAFLADTCRSDTYSTFKDGKFVNVPLPMVDMLFLLRNLPKKELCF